MTRASTRARFNAGSQHRRSLIAKVHVAKTQLGLSDDDYRGVLLEVGGATSAAKLDDDQLVAVVKHFTARGFTAKARAPGTPRPADHPVASKARALWISLHQLGEITDPSEVALEAFARRQLKVARLQWADQSQGYKLIEALKAMAERAGWSQKMNRTDAATELLVLKKRLVDALNDQMRSHDLVPGGWTIERAAWELGGLEIQWWLSADVQELDLIARTFAAKLHQFRASSGEHA